MKKYQLLFCSLLLCLIGLIMVYSSSHIWALDKFNDAFYYIKRQGLFALLGLIGLFILTKIDYHLYYKYAKVILFFSFILLILVLIPGLGQVRGGSRSWFSLGAFSLQPSEIFKLAIIIYGSRFLANNYPKLKKVRKVFLLLLLTFLGFGLIMLQPDFGTGIVMLSSVLVMVIASPFPFKYFILLGFLGIIGLVLLILSAPYRLQRILAFLDPFQDPLGSGFQMIQSLYAIGPGGLVGVGFDQSIQKHFYLPEPQTDFIFAVLCEENGFIGGSLVVLLYCFLIFKGLEISQKANDLFGSYLALGITAMLGIQIIINLCVVVGLFPVTGVTLPFMSYGGTSLTIVLSCIGILQNIASQSDLL